MRHSFIITYLVVMSCLMVGCSTHGKFTYPLGKRINEINHKPPNVKVAVLPANDLRGMKNSSAAVWLCYIPLVPYGTIKYDRPEASRMFMTIGSFEMEACEDVSKAVATHFQKAGFARNVFFDYGGLRDQADYTIEIDMRKMQYEGRLYTYCVSFLAGYLHIFGIPMGKSMVHLDMDMTMYDRDGNKVWEHEVKDDWSIKQGLYYGNGRDMEGVADTLYTGLNDAVRNAPKKLEEMAHTEGVEEEKSPTAHIDID